MPDSNGGTGAAVAEVAEATDLAKTLTLFQIEDSLVLLAESAEEEGLTPEIEGALIAYLEGAVEKRDRVAEFIHFCDGMAELAKAEAKRLQARQKHFEATAERVSNMVLHVLDWLGVKKLEGRTNTLKKRKCPPSVNVFDEQKIPAEYKRVTVTLPHLASALHYFQNEGWSHFLRTSA
jgi:Siphovirus Gp157